jgi:hypothetical protein
LHALLVHRVHADRIAAGLVQGSRLRARVVRESRTVLKERDSTCRRKWRSACGHDRRHAIHGVTERLSEPRAGRKTACGTGHARFADRRRAPFAGVA